MNFIKTILTTTISLTKIIAASQIEISHLRLESTSLEFRANHSTHKITKQPAVLTLNQTEKNSLNFELIISDSGTLISSYALISSIGNISTTEISESPNPKDPKLPYKLGPFHPRFCFLNYSETKPDCRNSTEDTYFLISSKTGSMKEIFEKGFKISNIDFSHSRIDDMDKKRFMGMNALGVTISVLTVLSLLSLFFKTNYVRIPLHTIIITFINTVMILYFIAGPFQGVLFSFTIDKYWGAVVYTMTFCTAASPIVVMTWKARKKLNTKVERIYDIVYFVLILGGFFFVYKRNVFVYQFLPLLALSSEYCILILEYLRTTRNKIGLLVGWFVISLQMCFFWYIWYSAWNGNFIPLEEWYVGFSSSGFRFLSSMVIFCSGVVVVGVFGKHEDGGDYEGGDVGDEGELDVSLTDGYGDGGI